MSKYYCNRNGQYMFFEPPKNILFNKDTKLWRQFLKFHNRNPHIYEFFKEMAIKKLESGEKFSHQQIMEDIRWDPDKKLSNETFSLSNNHITYYARIFLEDHPEYWGCFELRGIKLDA